MHCCNETLRVLWKHFFLYHSKFVIKVLDILDKYKHICVICRQTGSLAIDNVPSRTEYSIASCWYSQ